MKAKINLVLEKKLEELESLLEVVTFKDDDPNVRKLQLAVVFATTLLAAESSSRSMDGEGDEDVKERFRCIAKRLTEIDAFVTNQLPGHDNVSLIEPEMGNVETNAGNADGETGSVYSVVESCPNESSKEEEEEEVEEGEEEEEEEEVEAKQRPLFQDASSEERDVTFPAVEAVKEEVVVREVKENGRVGFRALVCFGLIGLVFGMKSLFGYVCEEDTFFVTPT